MAYSFVFPPVLRLPVSASFQSLDKEKAMLKWEWEQFREDRARFDDEVVASRRSRRAGDEGGPQDANGAGKGGVLSPGFRATQVHLGVGL